MAKSNLEFDDNIKFGLEIEFSNARCNNVLKDVAKIPPNNEEKYSSWTVTDESFTVKKKNVEYGGELQSPILKNDKKSLEDLRKALQILKKHRASYDGNQSLQVRVSSDLFKSNIEKLYRFLKLYLAYEDIIFKFGFNGSKPRESLMTFSRPCDYKLKGIVRPNFLNISYYSAISLLNNILFAKQHGLSFFDLDNRCRPSSIEYRMFNTTFNYNETINIINLAVCLLQKSCSDEELDMDLIDSRLDHLSKRRRTKEDYTELKENKAIEFANIIFNQEESKNNFLLQYKKK